MADPATPPDVRLVADEIPHFVPVSVTRDGIPVDLSGSTITATVSDNETDLGTVAVDRSGAASGRLVLTIDSSMYGLIKRYATLRLFEGTIFQSDLMTRRLVKA